MAKWEIIRKSRMSGSYEYDPIANCLPPGMPQMMSMAYGMEIMQGKDRITFFSEWQDALRRVYIDGSKPSATVMNDPTYAGYSTGTGKAIRLSTPSHCTPTRLSIIVAAQRR
jgi:hypothetical protein